MCSIVDIYIGESNIDILKDMDIDIIDHIYMLGNMVDINTQRIVDLFKENRDRIRRCRICGHCYIATKENRLVCSDYCRKISQQQQNKRYTDKTTKKKVSSEDVVAIARAGLDQQGYESKYLDRVVKELGYGQADIL